MIKLMLAAGAAVALGPSNFPDDLPPLEVAIRRLDREHLAEDKRRCCLVSSDETAANAIFEEKRNIRMNIVRVLVENGAMINNDPVQDAWVTSDDAMISAFLPMSSTLFPAMYLLRAGAGYRIMELACKAARSVSNGQPSDLLYRAMLRSGYPLNRWTAGFLRTEHLDDETGICTAESLVTFLNNELRKYHLWNILHAQVLGVG